MYLLFSTTRLIGGVPPAVYSLIIQNRGLPRDMIMALGFLGGFPGRERDGRESDKGRRGGQLRNGECRTISP